MSFVLVHTLRQLGRETDDLLKDLGLQRFASRVFTIWTSMLERKAGQPKFRIVTGAEVVGADSVDFYRVFSVDFHVFIGGILPAPHFDRMWEAQWLKLGGSGACLQRFDWPWIEGYLKGFSPDRRFEIDVKLPAVPRIREYS